MDKNINSDRRIVRANLIVQKVIAANARVVELKKLYELALIDLEIAVDNQDKLARANWSEQCIKQSDVY